MRRLAAMAAERARPPREQGAALVFAVALLVVSMAMLTTLAAYAVGEVRQAGKFRQRAVALALAEGQVDATIAQLSAAGSDPTLLPCGPVTTTDATAGARDTVTATTTVTYYDSAGAPVACPVPSVSAVSTALIRSVSTGLAPPGTTPTRRVMEAVVGIRSAASASASGRTLPRALFGDSGIGFSNHIDLFGRAGNDADIYTNGSFACTNNQHVRGSLVAQGSVTMANTCQVEGDVAAGTGFRADNPRTRIGGNVAVPSGNATLVSGATVGGRVSASGTITWSQCPGRCSPGAAVPPIAAEAFPDLPWDSAAEAAWASAGWTDVVTVNDCAVLGPANGPGQWLLDNAAGLTRKTILRTSCQLVLQTNSRTIELAQDVAVIADGGVRIAGSITVRSTTSTTRNLYLMQPSNAVAQPCTSDGIQLDNRVFVDATVTDLVYTPCNVRIANNSTHNGQIYAGGTITFDNAMTMYFRPLALPGLAASGTSTSHSTRVDLLSKRENT